MDQLISATAVEGAASLIDCRSLSITPVPLPSGTVVVVMDTMTRRELVDSEFAARMKACHRAAELLGVDALRDADDVSSLRDAHELEWRRARHVVAENARTLAAAAAMEADDAPTLGALMAESHASLRDLFEVSSAGARRDRRGGDGCARVSRGADDRRRVRRLCGGVGVRPMPSTRSWLRWWQSTSGGRAERRSCGRAVAAGGASTEWVTEGE